MRTTLFRSVCASVMNWGWQEEANLIPSDGAETCVGCFLRYDVALSGNTSMIGSPDAAGAGAVFVFDRRDDGTWEDVQKLTAADGENWDLFGSSVAISGDTAVIGAYRDDERDDGSGSGYVYTKIGGKWIENGKIVPEDDALGVGFGYRVAISGSTALFGALWAGDGGSAYIVDDLFVPC